MKEGSHAVLTLRTVFVLLLVGLVRLNVVAQAPVSQKFVTDDGHAFEVTLKPDKETIMLNEPIYVSFHFQSLASRDLCVGIGGDYRNSLGRPSRFTVSVVRDDGKPVPQPDAGPGLGGFVGCGVIPAGKTYDIRLFLPHWATFEDVGAYTIKVERHLGVQAYSADSPITTFKANVSARIEVVQDNGDQMGALINSLGTAMLENDNDKGNESASRLGYLRRDQRTLPYFASALEKFGSASEWSNEHRIAETATRVLSTFDDDRAIDALEKAMTSSVEDTRLGIADAFSASKHHRALDLLLTMKEDTYWFVRLRVAQRLANVYSKKSISILSAMLKDENGDVREAARESLDKLRKNDANGRKP